MNRVRAISLLLLAAALAPCAHAQDLQVQRKCETARQALTRQDSLQFPSPVPPPPPAFSGWCLLLASDIEGVFSQYATFGVPTAPTSFVDARDLQSNETNGAGQAGSPAQGEAVPSIEPFGLAGGTASAVGSEGGSNAVTALTINPAVFFLDADDPRATASWGRFTDLTVLFPLNDTDQEDRKIDYFGARARLNITGLQQGDSLYNRVIKAYTDVLNAASLDIQKIDTLLVQTATAADTTQLKACVDALLGVARGQQLNLEAACGGAASPFTRSGLQARLRNALEAARREADTRYFGLDLRTDFGDPTLGAVDSSAGTYLFGGVSWGKRFTSSAASTSGVRARLGVQFVDLDDFNDNLFMIDGGVGFELSRPFAFQQLSLTGGFEFRYGGKDVLDDNVETDYLTFRATINVPLTYAYSVSVNVGAPLFGDVSPIISINANWKLLWPDSVLPNINLP